MRASVAGCDAASVGIEAVTGLAQFLLVREADDVEPGNPAALARDHAVRADGDIAVAQGNGDRLAGVVEHLVAAEGDQRAFGVELEVAVAGVAKAAVGLDHQVSLAADRQVQWVHGWRDLALQGVTHDAVVEHERGPLAVADVGQILLEEYPLAAVGGGLGVGDVIGDDVHLAA